MHDTPVVDNRKDEKKRKNGGEKMKIRRNKYENENRKDKAIQKKKNYIIFSYLIKIYGNITQWSVSYGNI